MTKHDTVDIPSSKMKLAIAEILLKEGYIKKYDVVDDGNFKTIRIALKYGVDKDEKIITGLKEIAAKIAAARAQGDLSENAEYDSAMDEQRDMEARIAELEGILKNYEIIEEKGKGVKR